MDTAIDADRVHEGTGRGRSSLSPFGMDDTPIRPASDNNAERLSGITPLRPTDDASEIRVIGALPYIVLEQCGIETSARSVWIHPDVVRKIERKRRESADFILDHMADAIRHPHYCGVDRRDCRGRHLDLVHLVVRCEHRPLFVAVKVVPGEAAESGMDEMWVSTAHPLPASFLTQRRYSTSLHKVRS